MPGRRQAGACWDGPAAAAAPVAGRHLPFPGGLTFESQPDRLDGRCIRGGTEGGRRRGEDGEGRTINLVPGPCAFGVGRRAGGGGGGPRGQPEPLVFSPDGWPGHPRGPPLIDLGGRTENLALLWARASTDCTAHGRSSAPPLPPVSSPSQVIAADPRGSDQGMCEAAGSRGEI